MGRPDFDPVEFALQLAAARQGGSESGLYLDWRRWHEEHPYERHGRPGAKQIGVHDGGVVHLTPGEGGTRDMLISHPYGESAVNMHPHEEAKLRSALLRGAGTVQIHDEAKATVSKGEGDSHDLHIEHPFGSVAINLNPDERKLVAHSLVANKVGDHVEHFQPVADKIARAMEATNANSRVGQHLKMATAAIQKAQAAEKPEDAAYHAKMVSARLADASHAAHEYMNTPGQMGEGMSLSRIHAAADELHSRTHSTTWKPRPPGPGMAGLAQPSFDSVEFQLQLADALSDADPGDDVETPDAKEQVLLDEIRKQEAHVQQLDAAQQVAPEQMVAARQALAQAYERLASYLEGPKSLPV